MSETRTVYPAVRIVVQSKTQCSLDCPRLYGMVGCWRCRTAPDGDGEELRGTPDNPLRRPWCRKAERTCPDAAADHR